jgi:hypothetical protein
MTQLHKFEDAELAAAAAAEDAALRVTLTGTADSRVMAKLNDLLTRVHDEAARRKSSEVVVDFRALEFMNSSCFKAFVTWIVRVQGLATDAQYKIRFLSDKGKHWQNRSLGALSCFAVDLISVET